MILIELKRNQTSRDVVAQALDLPNWIETLTAEDLARTFTQFSHGGALDEAFRARFGQSLDEVSHNETHQIVIVAASLDARSERIFKYLNDRHIAIDVLFFQVFDTLNGHLLRNGGSLTGSICRTCGLSRRSGNRETALLIDRPILKAKAPTICDKRG